MIIPIMGINDASIANSLFTKVQQAVLSVLFGQPDRAFYGNEIIKLAGVGVGAASRELSKLTNAGLLTVKNVGNQKHYQANANSPIFSELRSIILKTSGLTDLFRRALSSKTAQIQVAFIFGSVAKGQDHAKSDIDLMVVSDTLSYPDLFDVLSEAETQAGRTVNASIYTLAEWRSRVVAKNDFVMRVLEQDKLFVVGTDSDLRNL